MQPAYYENLEEIQNKYWSMLDDAVTNRGSPFRIPVFICTHQDEVEGRIVVLRKSDRNSNVLQFHTDLRSPKVDILKKNIFDRIYGYELCTNIYMIKEYAFISESISDSRSNIPSVMYLIIVSLVVQSSKRMVYPTS